MKKLIGALLVAILCMVAPAAALDWDLLPLSTEVWIDPVYEPGLVCDTYFDLYLPTEEGNGVAYAGWCVNSVPWSIRDQVYGADLTTTTGVSEKYNKVNWVLNHKGQASSGEVQAAIWIVLSQPIPDRHSGWNTDYAQQLAQQADPSYIPKCYPEVGGVLVVPTGEWAGRQSAIIEIPMPPCPPVPEFPTMMIPVFLVGSILVAASVLKKE